MAIKICPICEKGFHCAPSDMGRRKTCSQKCRGRYLHILKLDAPCSDCGQKPRMKGRSYCVRCNRRRHLETYYEYKTSPFAHRLTEEERQDKLRKKRARYHEKYRDRLNAQQRRYSRTHYEIIVKNNEKRRARKSGVICDLTQTQWKIIKAVYQYRCAYCGKKPKMLTKDHIIPLSKGGGHTADNIVPSCKSCNSRKYTSMPPDFQPILIWRSDKETIGLAKDSGSIEIKAKDEPDSRMTESRRNKKGQGILI